MADRRASWPWRKKSTPKVDKVSLSPAQPASPATSFKYETLPSSTQNGRQEPLVPIFAEDPRLAEAICLREQAEANLKALKEELSDALKDAASKEAMAKQHEKVMDEAVSGWEKAEKEALSYKQELEAASKQKTILEDRIAHLDGALKECMKQVRHVKEEQERKIDETILTKTREWEKIKAEVDAKQVELERRLMESEAQNSAMAKSLQERAKKILEANEAKERAETQGKVLQVKVGSLEKEISSLKYELHVLSKELEIRNEEVECNKKAADAAHKQHLDNVKKVAKTEADCQRLRNLVRKKLPGPAAIAQMRREVEGPSSRENVAGDMKRRPIKSLTNGAISFSSSYQSDITTNSRDVELLKDRMSSMEEETKMLKEALSKRNEELHASRMLCAKTANKLSIAEDHIESLQGTPKETRTNFFDTSNTEPSIASVSEEATKEASCAESWASALMSELALFKRGEPMSKEASKEQTKSCHVIDSSASNDEVADNFSSEPAKETMEVSIADTRLQELGLLCKELDCEFSAIEEQLRSSKSDNNDNDKQATESLMSSFDMAHQKFAQLEKLIQAIGEARPSCGGTLPSSPATMASSEDLSLVNPIPVSSLRIVLSKLIVLLEALLPRCKQREKTVPSADSDSPSKQENGTSNDEALPPAWNEQKQALITSKDSFLEGKSAVSQFLIEFGIILCEACDSESAELEELLGSVNAVSSPQLSDVSSTGFISELALARDQLQQVVDAKAELEMQMTSISEELGGTKLECDESKELVINLQNKVAGLQAIEKNLSEVEAIKVDLQRKLEAAEGEVSKLQASVASLTLELAEEKKAREAAAAKCEELERQLQGRLIYEDECNGLKVPDDEDTRLGKERELVAAKEKLSECQRTILALGKQLSALSSPPTELSPRGSFDTVSMDSASLMIEQRMQMELQNGGGSMEHHSNSHQNYHQSHHHGDGRYNGELTSPRAPMGAPGQYNAGHSSRRNAHSAHSTPQPPPPMPIHSGWNSAASGRVRTRAYNEEMVDQTPRSWAGHSNGSFNKGARHQNGGQLPETEHTHHHHNYQQPVQRRPAYVSPSCQYSQRHYDGGPTWAPAYLPEEEEHQLALTVYSPPHTAMSSPARSPARYVQQLGGGRAPSRTAIRTSLTESMNAAATSPPHVNNFTESKAPSKPSGLGKLFSRSKNHR